MTDRVIYISRSCPHCKKLLLGIHKYEFLRPQFQIVDVMTQRYPDYIDTVPSLITNGQMIKNNDVFSYMNNMVEQIFQKSPELKQKYHPQQSNPQQSQSVVTQQSIGQTPQKINSPPSDPVDDIIGWCPDGGCSFSPISEQNDDCSKGLVTLEDTRFSFIDDSPGSMNDTHNVTKIPIQNDNQQFQKSDKLKKMDESYERLMAERRLVTQ